MSIEQSGGDPVFGILPLKSDPILQVDTKPGDAARDAARNLMTIPGTGDYLDYLATVTWFRREHPEAQIRTALISEEEITVYVIEDTWTDAKSGQPKRKVSIVDTPDPRANIVRTRQAIFKCEIFMDGEIISSGYGNQTRAQFASYLMKAQSIAVRNACIHAGYDLEMLQQLGFETFVMPPRPQSPPLAHAARNQQDRPRTTVAPQPAVAAETPKPTPDVVTPGRQEPTGQRASIMSGEFGKNDQDPNTPLGAVQAVDTKLRQEWRNRINSVFTTQPNDFKESSAILAKEAAGDIWKWIIFLQVASDARELNHILARAQVIFKEVPVSNVAQILWAAAGKERAAAIGTPPAE